MFKRVHFKFSLFFRNFGKIFFITLNFLNNTFRSCYVFFRQNISIMIVPHVKGDVHNIKISFLTLIVLSILFLSILLGFIFLAMNYVTLKSILRSNEKNYAVAKSNVEDLRIAISDVSHVSDNFSKTLRNVQSSLSIRDTDVNLNHNKLDGDFVSFSNLQIFSEDSLKELYDLKNLKTTIENSLAPLGSIVKLLKAHELLLNDIPSISPISGGGGVISLHFGPAVEPFTRQWYIHKGVDLAGIRLGTPIVATADGVVIRATYQSGGYGNFIQVKHKYGLSTLYAHMSRLNTSKGAYLKKGQTIGFAGRSGYATGVHLHYEVIVGSQVVNPDLYLNILTRALK